MRYVELRLKLKKSLCDPNELKYLVDNFSYGDWFVISLIQKNMDAYVFAKLLGEIKIKMLEARRKDL